jgi:L-asparaginase
MPGADGPANILAAIAVASSKAARALGCLVVLNDQIHAARFVQKSHTTLSSAFTSGESGPLGSVIEGKARINMKLERLPLMPMPTDFGARVALLTVGLGDDGRLLRELPRLGYQAVVLAAMGVGHVPSDMVPAIEATSREIPIVLASRVPSGPTLRNTYGFSGSERDLLARGVWSAGYLSALKARLLLSMLLASGMSASSKDQFSKYA